MSLHTSIQDQGRRRGRWVALLLSFAIVLAACADDGDSSSESFAQVDAAIGGAADESPTAEAPSDPGESEGDMDDSFDAAESDPSPDDTTARDAAFGAQSDQTAAPQDEVLAEALAAFVGREIIKTGDLVLEADDVSATADAVVATVFDNGGAIWGQETQTEPTPRAELTIRVRPVDFEKLLGALTRMNGVGVVSRSTTSDDVTEVVIDLDARITAAESSVARVQELLDAANDLNTIFQLEEELATREANLERLRGQRKTIGDQVALSTITVTIVELDPDRKSSAMEVVAWIGEDLDAACPGSSDLEIGENGNAVLCVSVSNTGDDVLTDIDLQASPFRLRVDDFTVQPGIGTLESLEPGDDVTVFVELEAEGGFISRVDASSGITIDVTVTATPLTTVEAELSGSDSVFVSADVEDTLPGFNDSFSKGWNALIAVLSVMMIAIAVLLPFVPLLILVVWLGRRFAAKSKERSDARAAFTEAYLASTSPATPTPPPPPSE